MARAGATHWQAWLASEDDAFDAWVHRALEERYNSVLTEPLPSEWLHLIEQEHRPDD